MARFFILDRELPDTIPPGLDLVGALHLLETTHPDMSICIKSLEVDGRTIPLDVREFEMVTAEVLEGADVVRIVPAEPREVALSAIVGFHDHLGGLEAPVQALVAEFRKGGSPEANRRLATFLEGLHQLFRLLEMIEGAGFIDPATLEVEGRSMLGVVQDFHDLLEELVACMEEQNAFLISDLLEFEFPQQVEMVAKILTLLRERLEASE